MACTRLPVEPRDFHVLALVCLQSEVHLAAWIVRPRQSCNHFQGRRTEQGRRNFVVRESLRCCQRFRDWLALSRSENAEIAVKHGRRGNVGNILRRLGTLNCALISTEEEKLVLYDCAADNSAELISLQRVALRREEISRIEDSIAHKLECIAVELIRARFCDDVHVC